MTDWRNRLDELDSEHRHMLEGGTLSQLFLRYPLYISHPIFIGSFYGFLVGLTLLLPYTYFGSIDNIPIMESLRDWGIQTLMLITLCSFLGGSSSIIASISKRPPIRLENRRRFLFPFPFIGLAIISVSMMNEIPEYAMFAGWVCFILPGPLYVHLSYAPRWRIIDRLDRDLRPFEGMIRTIDSPDSEEVVVTEDDELEEVVDES
ncbi:MAG TPA: hypothetical protein D7H75_04515 [Candidatus Poseidoniales archaeon]|nr:MAG TPA: hypothetical protein D7H75_04515 [Candidatus Poseidoniales archaeon]HIH56502.1 hypothetical protein [Candidatus Thalassarchaeum sp.]